MVDLRNENYDIRTLQVREQFIDEDGKKQEVTKNAENILAYVEVTQ